eukprot:TRINITY_DN58364_c0_g1_i1.p1 TRINITY_DN58364_c0_g1~~TRINITY_DN58364_c0_g1_i1.p1  ORF type:complete len:289 (+),score=31.94 TRINITY_DN58364_c0_g1_i1:55-921(+)
MIRAIRGTRDALLLCDVHPKATTKLLLELSSEIDVETVETCSTQDSSSDCGISESSSISSDGSKHIADGEGLSSLMRRPLAEVPAVEDNGAHELGRACSFMTALTKRIDRSMAPLRSNRSCGENNVAKPGDATQRHFAQEFTGIPQPAGNIDDVATADENIQNVVNTDRGRTASSLPQRGDAVKGRRHTTDAVAVAATFREGISFYEHMNRSPFWIYTDKDKREDEEASVDSGVSGPPVSRASAHDMGCMFHARAHYERRRKQDARRCLDFGNGSRGAKRNGVVRLSL